MGRAVVRRALAGKASEVYILGLTKDEVSEALQAFGREFSFGREAEEAKIGGLEALRLGNIWGLWGNVFVRAEMKDLSRGELLSDERLRRQLIEDVYFRFNEEIKKSSYLYQVITAVKPHFLVDTINTATALAYQDVYEAGLELYDALRKGEDVRLMAEKMLLTAYVPQLVRHMEILRAALRDAGVEVYLKVGTTGTGGMGWDIPYTHSEDRPSRVLLSKTAMAGAQTLLSLIMSRASDACAVKEIKPAAAIAFKAIDFGAIRKKGKPIEVVDAGEPVKLEEKPFSELLKDVKVKPVGDVLRATYIDTGENGLFSIGEFEALTALDQMEFVTPEEIAYYIELELGNRNTGRDVIAALESSVMGPTYRAGILREDALRRLWALEELHGEDGYPSVAFELLGPPRLSKLLFEATLLKRIYGDMKTALAAKPDEISQKTAELITQDHKLRQEALSVGIPILMPDGKLLVGAVPAIPLPRERHLPATPENVERWAYAGWVDLRPSNWEAWHRRFHQIVAETEERIRELAVTSGSSVVDRRFIRPDALEPDYTIRPGEVVAWVFIHEEKGRRTRR